MSTARSTNRAKKLAYLGGFGAIAAAALLLALRSSRPGHRQEGRPHVREPLPSPAEIAKLPPDGGPEFNRLIHETSPYLLQHARNPVDWYPWGDEAFERARREDKPVFVSIGYSTCHWCHVMERESFENEDVAAFLNAHFICIKVDREERPDIDDIYMKATQLLTGRGGWPNSVWLAPDRRPWFAGTYFPREDHFGRPGFKTILKRMSETWETQRTKVEAQADRLAEAIERFSPAGGAATSEPVARDVVQGALDQLRTSFDARFGGFGGAPKFPPHGSLRLLLYEHARTKDARLLEMATRTLDAMAHGGMYDHVGGGFHRYSTDKRWFVPHFEKMLYDNAQLSRAYVDAHLITGNDDYRRVAEETYGWVLREMTDEMGGFYSALDADSEGQEGKFYVWTPEQIKEALGKDDGALFCRVYHVEEGGNFRDEATGKKPGTNILYLSRPLEQTAKAEGMTEGELRSRLAKARRTLLQLRAKRIWPELDDKVLTSWNGLMIGSLAHAGGRLNEPRYTAAAEKAASFILTTMRKDGRLVRSYRAGEAVGNAYLDDYAFLADGLLDLYDTTGDRHWLDEAKSLADVMMKRFGDEARGGFFFTSDDHEALLVRSRNAYDAAMPSGNSVAAQALIRLGELTGEPRYREEARACLDAFADAMRDTPRATEGLLLSVAMYFDAAPAPAPAIAAGHARERPVTVDVFLPQRRIAAGDVVQARVRLAIDDGWRINSSKPSQEDLVATSIALGRDSVATVRDIAYPAGREVKLAFEDQPLSVYEGEVSIRLRLSISPDAPPGPSEVALTITFQACDDRRCLPPKTLILTIPLAVGRSRNGGAE